ncbi:MAG TPA: hypothetical protein VH640_00620, partial [Bryobacteraceae bacterium]
QPIEEETTSPQEENAVGFAPSNEVGQALSPAKSDDAGTPVAPAVLPPADSGFVPSTSLPPLAVEIPSDAPPPLAAIAADSETRDPSSPSLQAIESLRPVC